MKIYFIIFAFFASKAQAFPEMTTHGYVNCTSCHVSPSGGGLLTEYGRGLSKELLSMSGSENEESFLHGSIQTPKWLLAGGDVRAIQTYLDTPQIKRGEFFLMQADLSAAVKVAAWTMVASIGIKGGPEDVGDHNQTFSRIHYLMYQIDDTKSARIGRFMPQYGLNEPNHTVITRSGLGFGEETETDNAEIAYLGENWDTFLTGITGRQDEPAEKSEKGFAISSSFNFHERNKVGVSIYRGKNDSEDRWLTGAWSILGLSKKVFLLSEVDHQWATTLGPTKTSKRGIASYQRLGYEITQGVQVYATHQLGYLDFDSVKSRTDAFGPGFDFFPRPHFEIRAEWLKQRMNALGPDYFDFAWLLLHYYF